MIIETKDILYDEDYTEEMRSGENSETNNLVVALEKDTHDALEKGCTRGAY